MMDVMNFSLLCVMPNANRYVTGSTSINLDIVRTFLTYLGAGVLLIQTGKTLYFLTYQVYDIAKEFESESPLC